MKVMGIIFANDGSLNGLTEHRTTAPDTTNNTTENDGASGFVGIVIAIIAAIAVVLLIGALMPRKKNN